EEERGVDMTPAADDGHRLKQEVVPLDVFQATDDSHEGAEAMHGARVAAVIRVGGGSRREDTIDGAQVDAVVDREMATTGGVGLRTEDPGRAEEGPFGDGRNAEEDVA